MDVSDCNAGVGWWAIPAERRARTGRPARIIHGTIGSHPRHTPRCLRDHRPALVPAAWAKYIGRGETLRIARDVALKVLPDVFASDPERIARFEREAQVLGSLNHQNIAAIYGLEAS